MEKAHLAARIYELRNEQGLSQVALAEKCGMQPANLSRLEAGLRMPTIATAKKLASALGVSVSYLIGETNFVKLSDLLAEDEIWNFYNNYRQLGRKNKETVIEFIEFLYRRQSEEDLQ